MKNVLTGRDVQRGTTLELDYCEQSDDIIHLDTLSIEPGFWVDSDSVRFSIISKVIKNSDGTEKIEEEAEISLSPGQIKVLVSFLQTI